MEEKNSFKLFLIEASAGFLAFLIILFAVERSGAFDFHLREHSGKHRWGEFYETAGNIKIDAFIVGNSQALAAVDCDLLNTRLNKTFFAIGHDGAGISSLYWSLHHALNYVNPSTIFLETKCFGYSAGLYEFKLAISSRRDLGFRNIDLSVLKGTAELHGLTSIPFTLFGSGLSYPEVLETDPILTIKSLEKWGSLPPKWNTKLGFQNKYKEGIDDTLLARYDAGEAGRDYANALPNSHDTEYMDRLISLCKQRGIEILFFETPYFQADQKNLEKRQNALRAFFDSRGLDWTTFWRNEDLISNPKFYENRVYNQHLTISGAKAFTLQLAKLITDKRVFSSNE